MKGQFLENRLKSLVQGMALLLDCMLFISVSGNKVGICSFLPGYFYILGFIRICPSRN